MRNFIIAGNWKLNKNNSEAKQLANQIKIRTTDIKKTEILVCPPFTALSVVNDIVSGSRVSLGAQNIFWEGQGAFTAEISADMIKSTGAHFVIIGHSERRLYFGETDETVNKRLKAALQAGLKPIICVGETLKQREAEQAFDVIAAQINGAFKDLSVADMQAVIIAYEPVWAIGTGKTASPQQAQDIHAFIRGKIEDQFGADVANALRIQYGGSVKEQNAKELLSQPDIDGALVGGACLKAETFVPIIQIAESLS